MDRNDDKALKAAAELLNSGDVDAAERIGRELLAANPRNINGLRLLGAASRKRGELERSLEYFTQALQLNDRSALLHFEQGTAYTELRRSAEAFACYKQAVELDPKLQAGYVNLSAVMEEQERYEEAIAWARQAIALKPDSALAHYNLANAHRELGDLPAAIAGYEESLRHNPGHAKTHWNLGICHLLAGDFAQGWRLFEYRQDASEVFFDRYPQPRWDGAPLTAQTLVVHAEQGIGDEILFASCFSDVLARVDRCVLVCDPRLERLFARSFPAAQVFSHLRRKDWSPPQLPVSIDRQIPAGSLPLLFRPTRASFPRRERFLTVDPQLTAMWRERFAALGPGLKIGVSWRAGGKPLERRKRTLALDQWADIFRVPGTQFVNLQYGDAGAELAAIRAKLGLQIHDWEEGDPLVDVDSYAAKIAALDLVISVGNATVHIAGAVGTPAWTLLPKVPSWRWLIAGEDNPWYACVRLLRQPRRGDWESVLERVAQLLREKVGGADRLEWDPQASAAPAAKTGDNSRPGRWYGPSDLIAHTAEEHVGRMLKDARRREESGDLSGAESLYREVLQLAPRHLIALNGLGVLARKTGRTDLAIRSFRRALGVFAAVPEHQLNLADALTDAGRFEEALACYQRAAKLAPELAAAHAQAGRMLQHLERHGEACEEFERALAIEPDDADVLVALGRSLAQNCRIDDAIRVIEQAARLAPESAAVQEALGSVYLEDQRFAEAEQCFRRGLVLAPQSPGVHFNLGRTMSLLGRFADAATLFERALELNENHLGAVVQLAAARREVGERAAAAELFRRALAIKPADPQILNSLGVVLQELGDWADALDCFDDALQFNPASAEAHVNRAIGLLRSGRLAEGWLEYEWRWQCHDAGRTRNPLFRKIWDGGSLTGRTILVHGEQSAADEIMFASCYPDLFARAAACIIVCDPKLEPLFRRSFPQARVIAVARGREQEWRLPPGLTCDVQIPAGSLPRYVRPTVESFSRRERFLSADPRRIAAWKERIAATSGQLRVGIAFGGGDRRAPQASDQPASIESWRPLLQTPGAVFIDLEGTNHDVLRRLNSKHGAAIQPSPGSGAPRDFDDLAACIAACDAVVVAGGLTAHLAGGLGVPCWVVGETQADWRWLGGQDAALWYPSVRLCRPTRQDGPTGPFIRVRMELIKWIGLAADEKPMRSIAGPHWSRLPTTGKSA